ncbi:MAG TPA: DinB family protein [Vicinamibacterales bacterium]|nr:DinB family protein [Vicinamibacterales bacterium]
MAAPTPYAQYVGDRDPVAVLDESANRYRAVRARIADAQWQTPLAPGKWTLRQLIVHVTQWEMIFGVRVRLGVGIPNYVVQPLDQDPLMHEADAVDPVTAFNCFDALRAMNLELAGSLTPEQRRAPVTHPERGQIDVNDLLTTLAGHSVHHLQQLEKAVSTAP